MPDQVVGPFIMPGVDFETWLLRFDKHGACTSPETRNALLARLQAIPDTPVILFSHGWNNEFTDATGLYAAFLQQLDSHLRTQASDGTAAAFCWRHMAEHLAVMESRPADRCHAVQGE